ncbi:MAG: hypothetical protein FWF22_01320, partial [Treponema sp.]|nr:hypothetical protein [Treponema sp.]
MRLFVRIAVPVFCFLALFFLIESCENPIGLGSKVNTEYPVIAIPNDPYGISQPGSYLHGSGNLVFLDVQQEFGLDSVFMTIEYTDLAGNKQSKTVGAVWDENKDCYSVNVDTLKLNMADGTIKTFVTAVDTAGKKTVTTDMVYIVKNQPPQIQMTIPSIKGGTMANAGYPAGQIPDFDDPDLNILLRNDPVYLGFDLMGIAEDSMGIADGFPRIMIWPDNIPLYETDADGIPLETSIYHKWQEMVQPVPKGLKAAKISWPMTGYQIGPNYRFRIWTKDIHGMDNFYPDRTDNLRGKDIYGNPAAADPAALSPKYIEFSYIAAQIPIITIKKINPENYNGRGSFTVEFNVNTQNPLSSITGYVTDKEDGSGTKSAIYNIPFNSAQHPTYSCILEITEEQARLWPTSADGNMFVHLSAIDVLTNVNPAAYRNFIYDVEPPVITVDRPVIPNPAAVKPMPGGGGNYVIYYPSNPPKWVTGQITIGGLSRDSFGVSRFYYHIGNLGDERASDAEREAIYRDPDNWSDTMLDTPTPAAGWSGTAYGWSYTNNFNGYKPQTTLVQNETDLAGLIPDTPDFKTTGTTRFYLPFYVKAEDKAGNIMVVHYKLCIDPDLDFPQVNISYPEEGALVGGEVRLSGTASDNNWIHTVMIRIWNGAAGQWYIPAGAAALYPEFPILNIKDGDTAGWFRAGKIGDDMVVGWFYNINSDGKLNLAEGTNDARIEVRAVDTKDLNHISPDIVGPASVINVKFSSEVPTISTPVIVK